MSGLRFDHRGWGFEFKINGSWRDDVNEEAGETAAGTASIDIAKACHRLLGGFLGMPTGHLV